MRRRLVRAVVIGVVAALATAGTTAAVVPANGGDAGGTLIAINDGPGDQTEPRVSGDLATYTEKDFFNGSKIHYYDFLTGFDRIVPGRALGDSDNLSDLDGSRIVLSRTRATDNQTGVILFDTKSGVTTELDTQPQPVPEIRFGVVIGGDTVAYQELSSGGGDIFAYDLVTGTATNLTGSPESDGLPAVAPGGGVLVWERCVGSNCDIFQSVRSGGTWGTPTIVAETPSNEGNPDTDGTTVVYDSERPSATVQDIYLRPVGGGAEVKLDLAGFQRNPSISNGVVAFESSSTFNGVSNVYVYVIATNALFRVTDTPALNETLNDISVLPNGAVRVVWAATEAAPSTDHDVYARTFSLPAAGDTTPPAVTITAPAQGATYTKDQAVAADYSCVDEPGGSGLASCDGPVEPGDPVDTTTVGSHAFTVTGTDNANNSATQTHDYSVVYDFDGFLSPVENPPVLNLVKGGQGIPVRFSLGGDQGLSIFESGYPKSQQVPCDPAAPVDGIEETVTAGASSLSYDANSDQYSYVWKTEKGWANTCRQLVLKLADGTYHRATFKFR